jgi:ribonuclease HI
MKKTPKKLDQLISFIEEKGLDWSIGDNDTSIYWAKVFLKCDNSKEESKLFSSRGTWETPIEALSDAYARYTASKYKPIFEVPRTVIASEPIADSVCVDASCIGNPGKVAYKGIYTATNDVLFHKTSILNGTNNLGEFLAIVHALAHLKNQGIDIPIYSDSETAIVWVKNKKVKTQLKPSSDNEEIFKLIDRALNWLKNNNYTNPVLKWNTQVWGEIPADFGRK